VEVKISRRGSVVIPAELRRKYSLNPGGLVTVVDYGGIVSLVPRAEDAVEQAAGMVKGRASLTKAILKDHRWEQRRGR
jgi:AbrB family looped-hinge helix DNA binding protein